MTFTLNKIASDKANAAAKRGDAISVHIDHIKIVDGFNERQHDDEVREHIASIAGSLAAGLPIPPIEVWVNPENGDIELVDGHCRHAGYKLYAQHAEGKFDGYISAVKFDGAPAQRKARIVTSNNQLKLKPVELGRVYLSLRDEHGMSRQEIATEVGKSLAHVDQLILLASGSDEVIAAVEAGDISATEAVKLVRDHGQDAPQELERRKEAAREIGKDRVTAKVATQKAPSRPRVDLVVSNAVVLVKSLDEIDLARCDDPVETKIEVSSHILADLIMAVREMQQAGKPLDGDKQVEMEIS